MKQLSLLFAMMFSFSSYSQLANISPDDLEEGDFYGFVIDIHEDDLFISAYLSGAQQEDAGAIYHYRFDGTEWQLNQLLVPTGAEALENTRFGGWLAVSDDWMVTTMENLDMIGSVIFYKREGDSWVRHSKVSDNVIDSGFGWQVDIDGNVAVIGAIVDVNNNGVNTGSAYVYEYNPATDVWKKTTQFLPIELERDDFFGSAVYIQDDLIAVSARNDNENGFESGAVYVFEKDMNEWTRTAKLLPDDAERNDKIGYRVNGDGERLIISGYGNNNETGSAYIFTKENNNWVQEARLLSGDSSRGDWFGSSIVIEGNRAIVGARRHTGNAVQSGAIYVFEKENEDWIMEQKIIDPDGLMGDGFGAGLDFQGERLVVGSAFYNNFQGAAYSLALDKLDAIEELQFQVLSLYPNPVEDRLILDIDKSKIIEVEIYTLQGEHVGTFVYDSYLDVSQLSEGSYVVRSTDDNRSIGKFIKQSN